MCKLCLVFLFSLITGSNYGQGYFVLLQSVNRQPFYVRLGTQVYSSTPAGHLILSQLKDSIYTISIGFQDRPGVEQTYTLAATQKDQEFEIREHGEAGWGLYDAQGQNWFTAIARSGGREEVKAIGARRDDAFSRMMAGIVHDTAVLYNDYASLELATQFAAPGSANNNANNKRDTAAALITPIDSPAIKPEAVATQPARPDSSTVLQPKADVPAARPADALKPDSPAVQSVVASTQPGSSITVQLKTDSPAAQPAAAVKPDTSNAKPAYQAVSESPANKPTPTPDSSAGAPRFRPAPGVVKLSERKLTRNLRLVYADKGKGVKSDTVVVMIPLDTPQTGSPKLRGSDSARIAKGRITGPDSSRTARPRLAGSDSARANAARSKADSTRLAAAKAKAADSNRTVAAKPKATDSNRMTAAKPKVPDSNRVTAAKKAADSIRMAGAKLKAADSIRTTARTKGPNFDTPAAVRTIVPTPVSQPADKTRANDSAKKPATKTTLAYVNSDCHAFATDYDVDKLRVKMLEGTKDEERIAAALKVFKVKCFFTRQLRALSEIFTTDAAKYRFFETAYPFAADEHFRELVTLLADPVYANKFKTMTGGR